MTGPVSPPTLFQAETVATTDVREGPFIAVDAVGSSNEAKALTAKSDDTKAPVRSQLGRARGNASAKTMRTTPALAATIERTERAPRRR